MNSLESFVKFIPSANNPSLTLTIPSANILTDLESKSKRFTNHLNDTLYEVSNEPSLGLYRIQVSIFELKNKFSFWSTFFNYRNTFASRYLSCRKRMTK